MSSNKSECHCSPDSQAVGGNKQSRWPEPRSVTLLPLFLLQLMLLSVLPHTTIGQMAPVATTTCPTERTTRFTMKRSRFPTRAEIIDIIYQFRSMPASFSSRTSDLADSVELDPRIPKYKKKYTQKEIEKAGEYIHELFSHAYSDVEQRFIESRQHTECVHLCQLRVVNTKTYKDGKYFILALPKTWQIVPRYLALYSKQSALPATWDDVWSVGLTDRNDLDMGDSKSLLMLRSPRIDYATSREAYYSGGNKGQTQALMAAGDGWHLGVDSNQFAVSCNPHTALPFIWYRGR